MKNEWKTNKKTEKERITFASSLYWVEVHVAMTFFINCVFITTIINVTKIIFHDSRNNTVRTV